jgi:hypothetical protein
MLPLVGHFGVVDGAAVGVRRGCRGNSGPPLMSGYGGSPYQTSQTPSQTERPRPASRTALLGGSDTRDSRQKSLPSFNPSRLNGPAVVLPVRNHRSGSRQEETLELSVQ